MFSSRIHFLAGTFIHRQGVRFAVFNFFARIVPGFHVLFIGCTSPVRGMIGLPGSNLFLSDNVNPCQRPFPSRSFRSFTGIIISPLIDKIDARFLPSLAQLRPQCIFFTSTLNLSAAVVYLARYFSNTSTGFLRTIRHGNLSAARPRSLQKLFPRGTATGAKTG